MNQSPGSRTTQHHHQGQLLSEVKSVAGEGYSRSQAGIFIEGISGGLPVTTSITYQVRPLNNAGLAAINCAQGPLLRDDGTINGVPFQAINDTVTFSNVKITGPDANGFFTVTYDLTTQTNVVFTVLALFATNGGAYDIKNFALDGNLVPLDTGHPLSCPFGNSQAGLAPNNYCGP